MALLKQKSGSIDKEDYFMTGSLTDFLGGGVCSRKDGKFELQKGEIKREFKHMEFAAVVKLENVVSEEAGRRIFFAETNLRKIGVYETATESAIWWRITLSDGFVQTFRSSDGQAWSNAGGSPLEEGEKMLFLGFKVEDELTLSFSSCTAYASPFLKVLNFPENFIAKLLDEGKAVVKSEPFGSDMTARVVIDKGIKGYLQVFNPVGAMVQESELLDFGIGDVYLYTEYRLELRQGETLFDYGPNALGQSNIQLLNIKNAGDVTCSDLKLTAAGLDAGKITFSLDGSEYSNLCMVGDLETGGSKDFYVKIESKNQAEFSVYDFEIVVI